MGIVRLSFDERKIIEILKKEGMSHRYIADHLNRSKHCINYELSLNTSPYEAEAAQQRSEDVNKKKYEKISETLKKKENYNPFLHLQDKIEKIEMQIEIIIDMLRENK